MTMRNFLSAHAAQGGVRAGAVAATALALGLTGCSAVGSSSGAQSGSSAGGASAGASGAAGEDVFGEPADAGAGQAGRHAAVALSAEPDKLDPTLSRSLYSRYVFHTMCEKLYDVDPDAKIVPQLATALPTISDDGLTVTIPLREGVKFADGTPARRERGQDRRSTATCTLSRLRPQERARPDQHGRGAGPQDRGDQAVRSRSPR